MPEQILGFKKLSKQLSNLGKFAGGRALSLAASFAVAPAKKKAKANAPVGEPPYIYSGAAHGLRAVDPYPKKTYKGRYTAPGFASRNVIHRTRLSRDKTAVSVRIGVESEAFYAVQFIELGTSSIPARPWLEPAFRSSIPAMNSRFKQRLKHNIDKAARR